MTTSGPTASCHCGAIQLRVETAPETVTDCNCSICRRYGVLWAYYSPKMQMFAEGDRSVDRISRVHEAARAFET